MLLSFSALIFQIIIMLSFYKHLGLRLPTYFGFNGSVIYWSYYQRPIILQGILFLAIVHLGGLLLSWYMPGALNEIPVITEHLNSMHYIGPLLFSWFECLSWAVLLYFFIYNTLTTNIMMAINTIHLILFLFITIHQFKICK